MRISDYDLQIGTIEGCVVVAAIPENDVGFFLSLAQYLFIVHTGVHDGALAKVRLVFFALLNRALMTLEVVESSEALYGLLRQIAVRHGVADHYWLPPESAQLCGDQAR